MTRFFVFWLFSYWQLDFSSIITKYLVINLSEHRLVALFSYWQLAFSRYSDESCSE